jgi:CRISPR/Cas system-associated exonuclease Cas4 (RecB family)
MNADELATKIVQQRVMSLDSRITAYRRKNIIMSDLHECGRYLTYSVLDSDKRPLPSPELKARFEVGDLWEREIVRDLQGMGFKFILSQQPVEIKDKNGNVLASGRVDGFIEEDKKKFPVEIKTQHVAIFERIKTVDDFMKKPWLRRQLYQLQLYLYGNSLEEGIFITTDCLGRWKILPVYLDYGLCEQLLQRIEKAYALIRKKEYGERIAYDQSQCGKCPFSSICLQDILNVETNLLDSPEWESKLERHEELKPLAAEYDDIHENIKESFKGKPKSIVGGKWLIQSVPSKRTAYEIPEDVQEEINELKKAHAVSVPVERLVIEKIGN